MSTTKSFRGIVGGVAYEDPALFETAARDLGFRGYGRREAKWKVGTAVAVTLADGTKVAGQVWSQTDMRIYVWVALEDGRYVAVYVTNGTVKTTPRGDNLGWVAA